MSTHPTQVTFWSASPPGERINTDAWRKNIGKTILLNRAGHVGEAIIEEVRVTEHPHGVWITFSTEDELGLELEIPSPSAEPLTLEGTP